VGVRIEAEEGHGVVSIQGQYGCRVKYSRIYFTQLQIIKNGPRRMGWRIITPAFCAPEWL